MRKMSLKNTLNKMVAFVIVASILMGMCVTAFAAGSKNPVVSVVNFDPVYGYKAANIAAMAEIIEEAAVGGTDIIVFPELAVTGYASGDVKMPVQLAESKDGETAAYFSTLAKAYDMYIVYGAPETVEGDSEHAYNSAFVCTPSGYVDSYQKMLTAGEGEWCVAGETPVYFETEFGKVALSVGDDTFDLVELMRAYAADGCFMIASPSSIPAETYTDSYSYDDAVYCDYTEGYYYNDWTDYNFNRLYNISNMAGVYVASASLIGTDGESDEYSFAGGAMLVGPNSPEESRKTGTWTQFIGQGKDFIDSIMKTYAGSKDSTETLCSSEIVASYGNGSLVNSSLYQPNLYTNWFAELEEGPFAVKPSTDENPIAAVVNMTPAYADRDANVAEMLDYIKQAAEQDVDIITFPEMALGDYVSNSDPTSQPWKDVIATAETIDGKYATMLANAAKEYGMYVIYGTAEVNPDDALHPYNSAFVSTPEGETFTYRKIQPVEGAWPTWGDYTLIIDTPWGGMGISICMDTYAYPEMARYYAAAGCKMIINPTASGSYAGGNFIYNTTLSSIVAREGVGLLSSDLVNTSGYNNTGLYPGKSTILTTNGISPIYLTEESMTDEVMYVAELDLSNAGFPIEGYNAKVMTDAYAALAADKPIYNGSGLVSVSSATISGTVTEGKCGAGETATFDVIYNGEAATSVRFALSSKFPVLNVTSKFDCEFNPANGKVVVYDVEGMNDGDVVATVTVDLDIVPWAQNGLNFVQINVIQATNDSDEALAVYGAPATIIIANEYTPGDVNCDGIISNADLVLIARYLVDLETLSPQALLNADVNNDGAVGNIDLVLIARYLVA